MFFSSMQRYLICQSQHLLWYFPWLLSTCRSMQHIHYRMNPNIIRHLYLTFVFPNQPLDQERSKSPRNKLVWHLRLIVSVNGPLFHHSLSPTLYVLGLYDPAAWALCQDYVTWYECFEASNNVLSLLLISCSDSSENYFPFIISNGVLVTYPKKLQMGTFLDHLQLTSYTQTERMAKDHASHLDYKSNKKSGVLHHRIHHYWCSLSFLMTNGWNLPLHTTDIP